MITAVVIATFAALGFAGSSLLAARGGALSGEVRSSAIAVAAGMLIALAFGDLFPAALAAAGDGAVAGFIGSFALLFLIEAFTRAHTHHAPDEPVHHHAVAPFVLGLAIHNLADGFAVGISNKLSTSASGAVGFGVLIHQVPVGLSLAAVARTAHLPRREATRTTLLLALAIPLAAGLSAAAPVSGGRAEGTLTGIAAGVLAYLGTAHLLPEALAERPSRVVGVVFAATLIAMTIGLFTVLGTE